MEILADQMSTGSFAKATMPSSTFCHAALSKRSDCTIFDLRDTDEKPVVGDTLFGRFHSERRNRSFLSGRRLARQGRREDKDQPVRSKLMRLHCAVQSAKRSR